MKTLLMLLALLSGGAALARDHDHDQARRAVEAGEILPLRQILERAEVDFPGQFVEADLKRKHGRAIYKIKLLTANGRVLELYYDARSGRLLKTEEE